jgi:hypothetical protein
MFDEWAGFLLAAIRKAPRSGSVPDSTSTSVSRESQEVFISLE